MVIVIKIDGFGLIFYYQECIGCGGKIFGMCKFWFMVVNVDDQFVSLLDLQGLSEMLLFKVLDDLCIMKIGCFFCKYLIDELLQFVNVVCGDMSLVGFCL